MANKTRDQLRQSIFSSEATKPKSKVIEFFGEKIELRQPPVATILALRNTAEDSEQRTQAMIRMIIAYSYVPNTDEKVFEEADLEMFLTMPFGPDFTRVSTTIAELTDIKLAVSSATKNSDETPSGST